MEVYKKSNIEEKKDLVPSGSTIPSSDLTVGLYFRYEKNNRTILLQYDENGNWNPIRSFGEMTIYVSPLGTDDLEFGDGLGINAYQSITYAVSQIPQSIYGDCNVIIEGGNYTENVFVDGKLPVGDFKVKFTGLKR